VDPRDLKTLAPGSVLEQIIRRKIEDLAEREQRFSARKMRDAPPSDRSFLDALAHAKRRPALIAEIKKRSPSQGPIREALDLQAVAEIYDRHAAAISVVTDGPFFGGDLPMLTKARRYARRPVLLKDFVVSEHQVREARGFGADAILLMASVLVPAALERFLAVARSMRMEALVEVHDESELHEVLEHTSARIVGVNNRDLRTLAIDGRNFGRMADQIRARSLVAVSESGIETRADLEALTGKADAVLIGTTLMRAVDIGAKLGELGFVKERWVKICGVRSVEAASAVAKAGADFAGLNFVPSSKRCIDVERARAIIDALGAAEPVGVFMNQPHETIADIAVTLGLRIVQLHGSETPEDCRSLSAHVRVIKAITVGDAFDPASLAAYRPHVFAFLFDGPSAGSGTSFVLERLKGVEIGRPFFVAGGLTPENLDEPVAVLGPDGVDTASGIEVDGAQDEARIHAFVDRARRAFA
jgi:indole-3-glycerol phosphate synthase/phosphoribosylanthranilate isomerase/anthranilate synthase/indole-3-glycerol phosphate synthase/phosphoribosylanthranilate isomerase